VRVRVCACVYVGVLVQGRRVRPKQSGCDGGDRSYLGRSSSARHTPPCMIRHACNSLCILHGEVCVFLSLYICATRLQTLSYREGWMFWETLNRPRSSLTLQHGALHCTTGYRNQARHGVCRRGAEGVRGAHTGTPPLPVRVHAVYIIIYMAYFTWDGRVYFHTLPCGMPTVYMRRILVAWPYTTASP
jgi:hypothetical protein